MKEHLVAKIVILAAAVLFAFTYGRIVPSTAAQASYAR